MNWADELYLHHGLLAAVVVASFGATAACIRQVLRSPFKRQYLAVSIVYGLFFVGGEAGWLAGDAWSNQRRVERAFNDLVVAVPKSAHRLEHSSGPNFVAARFVIPGSTDRVAATIDESVLRQTSEGVRRVGAYEWGLVFRDQPCDGTYTASLRLTPHGASTIAEVSADCYD